MICRSRQVWVHGAWSAGLSWFERLVYALTASDYMSVCRMPCLFRLEWVHLYRRIFWSQLLWVYMVCPPRLIWVYVVWFACLGSYRRLYDLPVSVHMSACRMFACPADMSVYCMICMRRLRCMYVVWFPCTMHFTHRHQLNLLVCSIITTGAHFTNNFSITIQMWWKFNFALIQILKKWSLQYLAHDTTAGLSWHVTNFVAI